MRALFKIFSILLFLYSLALLLRVIFSWSARSRESRLAQTVAAMTDPYLRFFSRVFPLHIGHFDFSPLLAFLIVTFADQVFWAFGSGQPLTAGGVVYLFIALAWSYVKFSFWTIIIILIIRRSSLKNAVMGSAFGQYLDVFSHGITDFFQRRLFRHHPHSYRYMLTFSIVFLIVFILIIDLVVTGSIFWGKVVLPWNLKRLFSLF